MKQKTQVILFMALVLILVASISGIVEYIKYQDYEDSRDRIGIFTINESSLNYPFMVKTVGSLEPRLIFYNSTEYLDSRKVAINLREYKQVPCPKNVKDKIWVGYCFEVRK